MKKNEHRRRYLICGLILTVLLIFLPVVYTQLYHTITGAPEAANGSIPLSGINLEDKKVYLDGQWEFYWNEFIISDQKQVSADALLIEVPGEWSHYTLNDKSLTESGYGSYRLLLDDVSYEKEVTIYIPDFGSAYRVYIDGHLTAESGTASKDNSRIFTTPKADLYPVTLSETAVHEVVIEVATTRFSGLYMAPILADYHHIINSNSILNSVRLILFGIAFFSFLVLVTMYLFSVRQKLYSFWMPVMVLFILIRIMLTTEFYSFWQPLLFLNLSYELTNEFMYFVTFALKYLLIFLVEEQCGILFSKKEKIGFLTFYGTLFAIYLLVPQGIYNDTLSVAIPALTFTLDIYLFVKIFRWRDRLIKFGMEVFLGATLVIIGLATNSFYINGKIYFDLSLAMMIFFILFLLIIVWIYTLRMGDLYDDFTISSSRLELANKQIDMQKEYYTSLSRQMNEVREIKHDIKHFIGVMTQLAEDGNLERLTTFLSEYSERSQMDQLPVFCEHIIGNSIIGYYYLRAKECGILFESKSYIPTQTIMSDSDLCIVLGNALDNAVYACSQIESTLPKYVSIEISELKGQRLIKVTNSYQGDLNIKDGRYVSTKGGNSHGFGIQNISKVIESYGGFVQIENMENVFTLRGAVPNK